jgi:hypothetical protein
VVYFSNFELSAQSEKYSVKFNYGEFIYQYLSLKKDFVINQGKQIDTSIIYMIANNFGEVLTYYYEGKQNYKQAKIIRTNNDSLLIDGVKNKLDSALLVLSYLQVNMFDASKVETSVPHSGFFGGKNATYMMVADFIYMNNDWQAMIYFKRGIIVNLSLSTSSGKSSFVDFGKFILLKSKAVKKQLNLMKRIKRS